MMIAPTFYTDPSTTLELYSFARCRKVPGRGRRKKVKGKRIKGQKTDKSGKTGALAKFGGIHHTYASSTKSLIWRRLL
jgi:hypothetical protein